MFGLLGGVGRSSDAERVARAGVDELASQALESAVVGDLDYVGRFTLSPQAG
jgi:hypothetical protein